MSTINIFIPIWSPLISIILVVGLYKFGKIITEAFKIKEIISKISSPAFQYIMIGSVFLSTLIFPIIIFNLVNIKLFIKLISYFLIFLALLEISNLYISKKIYIKELQNKNINFLVLLFIIGYFLLSIAPITNADSLDYHIGIPLYVLNYNEYPSYNFWTHFTKSGSGELLNAVGLIVKAEQFPSLVQFSGILSITGILIKNKKKYNNLYLLLFLSCPVLILLVSSAKPQLNFIASSALIFTLIFFGFEKNFKDKGFIIFILVLLFSNINGKFSFALSSFLFFITIIYYCYKNNKLEYLLLSSIVIFSLTYGPKILWKHNVYEMSIIDSIFKPLPIQIYGYQQLYKSLTSCGYDGCFPKWVLFPTSINTLTETLGLGSLIIFFSKFKKKFKEFIIVILISLYVILAFFYGQNNPRWFVEVFVWLIITSKYFGYKNKSFIEILYYFTKFQSLMVFLVILFGVFSLTRGVISENLRDKVLTSSANGFSLFKWSNSKLKDDNILISTHRSFSLSNVKTIPGDIFNYIDISNPASKDHLIEIKSLKPSHILFYDDKKHFKKLSKCLGNLVYYNKKAGNFSSRNPFNRSKRFYEGFIYEFEYEKLPNCAFKN
ncbi:DUF1420 family protein [Candidatus Pelagibacter sp. HIMB1542]|uniref:DUF1420 family protein n=1 Tax=Candidatus Pelagibacter sp. HIMB1542 TaxID=3413346 RepID=UPI003F869BBA